MRVDFAVISPDDEIQLVVEVKARRFSDFGQVARFRRNLLAHDLIPLSPYFMLVSSYVTYLWAPNEEVESTEPDYHVDTRNILGSYFVDSSSSSDIATGYSLDIAVSSWLSDLILGTYPSVNSNKLQSFLHESGLLEAIRHGQISRMIEF